MRVQCVGSYQLLFRAHQSSRYSIAALVGAVENDDRLTELQVSAPVRFSQGIISQALSQGPTVIAHSVIKEHIYVLSEYYTTLHYLRLFSEKDLSSFVSLAKECKLSSTAKTHLTITAFLHGSAHGFVPKGLANLLGMLEAEEDFEIAGLVKNRFFVPHKYHPKTVLNAFLEKSSELKARQSFAAQIYHLLNPRFASSFVKLGLDHVLRSTY